MSHFAKINEDGFVVEVIVAEQDFIDTLDDAKSWIQTSYNTHGGKHYDPNTGEEDDGIPLRKNYASIGFEYDAERDAFIPEQPHSFWVLNEDTCLWEAPVAPPDQVNPYRWDDVEYSNTGNGWVLVEDDVE